MAILQCDESRARGDRNLQNSLFVSRGVLSPFDLELLEAQGAVGEICGHYFDRDGRECETDFRDRVISVGLDELSRIEDIICVTHGTGRTKAIHAALKGGLITSLVMDEAGARAVLESAGAATVRRPTASAEACPAPP